MVIAGDRNGGRGSLFWAAVATISVVAALAAVAGWFLFGAVGQALEAENTHLAYLRTLNIVSEYVDRTSGRWPRSWEDIVEQLPGHGAKELEPYDLDTFRKRIRIDCSVTCADVAQTDAKTFSAIEPTEPNYGLDEGRIEALLATCRKWCGKTMKSRPAAPVSRGIAVDQARQERKQPDDEKDRGIEEYVVCIDQCSKEPNHRSDHHRQPGPHFATGRAVDEELGDGRMAASPGHWS